jgi:hypothetical protein
LVSVGLAVMLLAGGWRPHGNSGVGVRTPWNHVDTSHSTPFETASKGLIADNLQAPVISAGQSITLASHLLGFCCALNRSKLELLSFDGPISLRRTC